MTVGDQIANLRKKYGLTQNMLAEQSGINASTIAAYERNRRTPKADAIKAIATAFGVTTETFQIDVGIALNSKPQPNLQPPTTPTQTGTNNLTTLTLTREEARLILFTRMNQDSMTFLQKYILADRRERVQIEKAWKLIHEFQA